MADTEAREIMDDCIDTIKRGDARSSLLQAGSDLDSLLSLETTQEKPQELELIMDLLEYKEDRVMHDSKKFILFRSGAMSYVYLASVKSI